MLANESSSEKIGNAVNRVSQTKSSVKNIPAGGPSNGSCPASKKTTWADVARGKNLNNGKIKPTGLRAAKPKRGG